MVFAEHVEAAKATLKARIAQLEAENATRRENEAPTKTPTRGDSR